MHNNVFWCGCEKCRRRTPAEEKKVMPKLVDETEVSKLMTAAIQTHLDRVAVYGEKGHDQLGEVLAALFPDGLTLQTPAEFSRFHVFQMIVAKVNRYANNYTGGGHADSIHDTGVYSFVLEAKDAAIQRTRDGR
jgi:hypothetical protein